MNAAFIAAIVSGDATDISAAIVAIEGTRAPTSLFFERAIEAGTNAGNTNALVMIRHYFRQQEDMQREIDDLLHQLAAMHDVQDDQARRITALEHPQAHEAGA